MQMYHKANILVMKPLLQQLSPWQVEARTVSGPASHLYDALLHLPFLASMRADPQELVILFLLKANPAPR